jgi:ribulose-phosphate 3-epimerase
MVQIVPAILATTAEEIGQKILRAKDITTDVQVDIVDGSFASPATWPYVQQGITGTSVLPPFSQSESMNIELDLMVDDPERTLSTWMNMDARRIVFHLESTLHMKDILETLRTEYGYEKGFMSSSLSIGIAINIETHLELLEPYLDSIDYVQFMGIKRIGVQGQPFAKEVLSKIELFRRKHADMPIQVDGAVSLETAPALLRLGVQRLVVGSVLFSSSDIEQTYTQFTALALQNGIHET